MRVVAIVSGAGLVACGPTASPGPRGSATTTSQTGAVRDATCVATDNPLRFRCAVALEAPGAVTLSVADRTFESSAAADHELLVWGLPPDGAWDWRLSTDGGSATGTLRTGSLAGGAAALVVDGGVGAWFAAPVACLGEAVVVVLDGEGAVRWYASVGPQAPGGARPTLTGLAWTPDGPLVQADDAVWRIALDGSSGPSWSDGRALHHDVAPLDVGFATLTAEVRDGVVVDGVARVEDGVVTAAWATSDAVDLAALPDARGGYWSSRFPDAADVTHANSVDVRDGLALVSLRWLDAAWAVDLDHGEVAWAVGDAAPAGVPAIPWPVSVRGQHDVTWAGAGTVALFDNGPVGDDSRGLVLDIDPDAGVATLAATLPLDRHCRIQGSVAPLEDGWLVTCAEDAKVHRFSRDGAWRSSVTLACPMSRGLVVPRAEPVDDRGAGG